MTELRGARCGIRVLRSPDDARHDRRFTAAVLRNDMQEELRGCVLLAEGRKSEPRMRDHPGLVWFETV